MDADFYQHDEAGVLARSRRQPWPIIASLLLATLLFAALGDWQLHRLAWKQALMARVANATTAPPLPLAALPTIPAADLEYRRVLLRGRYEPASTTLVTATSELGSGYWDMVALRAGAASPVWVNRGFVPIGSRRARVAAGTPTGAVSVTGLIRLTEPKGTWLRANRPSTDRWYSRDVAAMAQARHVAGALPQLFVDAQTELPRATGAPIPGLTVLAFSNSHLSYAVTWFALALVSAGGAIVVWRRSS